MKVQGLVVYLVKLEDGRVRIQMDDAKTHDGKTWVVRDLYTYLDVNEKQMADVKFTDKELAEIGFSLVARLSAVDEVQARKQ